MTLDQVVVRGNVSVKEGGGIDNAVNLMIRASSIAGNTDVGFGGGIFNRSSGNLILAANTVASNTASEGGGLFNYSGTMVILNSTIAPTTRPTLAASGCPFRDPAARFTTPRLFTTTPTAMAMAWAPEEASTLEAALP
ncbi:MAG: hypothetical protein ABI082_09460 [Dokdonella sp.]